MTQAKYLAVFFCGADDLALFAQVYGRFGRREFIAAAGFDLDKTKSCIIERDQIDLCVDRRAAHVPADRDAKICRYRT